MANSKTQEVAPNNGTSFVEPPEYDQIAALAYELWLARGCPEGSPEEDWLQAEQELTAKR